MDIGNLIEIFSYTIDIFSKYNVKTMLHDVLSTTNIVFQHYWLKFFGKTQSTLANIGLFQKNVCLIFRLYLHFLY